MIVECSTPLDSTPERAWHVVQTSQLLLYITAPLMTFKPVEPRAFPPTWQEQKYHVSLKLFGVIPFGNHVINISIPQWRTIPGQQQYQLRDNGYGDRIATWDHLITIKETADGRTHYTDRVEIRAGVLTPFIWLFAAIFYRYRQYRWRHLVRTNFDAVS